MLSRKGSCAGMMTAAAAADRGRVGERLQAALAGLHELHLLKDRHSDMVSWALKMDREEPVTCVPAGPDDAWMMGAEELRLEATLTSLKQQLSRLRKQDVGLKTHLQQLDQQISELKLDVSKASSEQLESDSRPSSGFYELSDGGSCSLSNSCTSVYSECLSSSQTSLLVCPVSPATSAVTLSSRVDVCRRRSADEDATQPSAPRAPGFHLGSSRIRASTACTEQARQRPVSTGDLERVMAQGPSYCKSADPKKPMLGTSLRTAAVDPRFQSNLVSRSGTEVYHYPSPLHAVALQSPMFYSGCDLASPDHLEAQGPPVSESRTLNYIDKLIQRSVSRVLTAAETLQTHSGYHRKATETEALCKKESVLQPPPARTTNVSPLNGDEKRRCMTYCSPEPADHKQSLRNLECRYSYPVAMREYSSDEVTTSSLKKSEKYVSVAKSHPEKRCGNGLESKPPERRAHKQRSVAAHSSSAEESQSVEVHSGHATSPEFVHAQFVPAGSRRVKVRQADRKTKAVKLRRRSGEKTGAAKGEQRRPAKGRGLHKLSGCPAEERRQGSGSDSSHCSPGLAHTQKVHPKMHPVAPAARPSKSRRPQHVEYQLPAEQRRRRQASDKWPPEVEMLQTSVRRQRSLEPPVPAPGNAHVVRSQWTRQPLPFQNSFLYSLNARYPPAPLRASSRYPPRCESEYSAECASLFHSTIAESSEGEMSDSTANRFGDGESGRSFRSLSDSDGSLSPDESEELDVRGGEGGLVWADAAVGPTAAGRTPQQLPRPEPPACRIKASRALKKKIRRFQPASLKVMTLV
ncbi:dapper homolog 2 [Betta splendens]|uniref:Dapper homolog 2 n=1 Tax=Betta splendens TaxID=158456 RepID=A0A6P7KPC0_BETSP|nr:dapper homolog 2 [Betta splendens]